MNTRAMVVVLVVVLGGPCALGGEPAKKAALKSAPAVSGDKPAVAGDKPAVPGDKPAASGDWHVRRGQWFQRNWGVDIVGVRRVSSGMMLRFDYRVVDPERAKVLADRKTRPYLIDESTGAALVVPAMEKIGELRQVHSLESGRTYFMIFGNPGGLVKPGSKVTLVAGDLRAEGLEAR